MDNLSDFIVVSPILDALLCKLDSLFDTACSWSVPIGKVRERPLTELRLVVEDILTPVLIVEQEIKRRMHPIGWLEEVQKAASEADDMLDRVSKMEVSMISINSSSNFLECLDPLVMLQYSGYFHTLFKIGRMSLKFKNLLEKQKNYDGNDTDINSSRLIREHFQCRSSPNLNLEVVEELMLLLQSNKVFGREDEKKKMLDLLFKDNKQTQLSVIPILGVDGIGKTTLARLLYSDDKVLEHFDLRAWVSCDAQEFGEEKIAKGIIESVTGFRLQQQPEEMGDQYDLVRDALESKTSLIVLDDIQFINKEDFEGFLETLKSFFLASALGSKVVVTTPSLQVEDVEANCEHHKLTKLSNEDSWSMVSYLASDYSNAINNSKWSSIVDSCRGLPLLLDLIGRLMRFEKERRDWISFQKFLEEMSELISSSAPPMHQEAAVSHDMNRNINPIVLSYGHLPSHLKQCFAYCSIFTRDHLWNKEKLIQMWIAEGLVQSFDGKRALEDIGNNYFRELVSRSFFTELRSSDSGDIIEFRMHGLIHDFAQRVAGGLLWPEVVAGVVCRQSRNMRQVSLAFSYGLSTIPTALHIPKHLRTLLLSSGNNFPGTLDHSFFRFEGLRVLDLSCSGIDKLSSDIRNLQHLRYLDLSRTFIKKLPNSIATLTNFQTLKLFGCYRLKVLPKRMHNLTNLRHLDIGLCHSLSHMPAGIGLLTSLQSMPVFVLGKNRGCAHLGELRRLNLLTGKLEIKNLENENGSVRAAHDAKLYQKERLERLGLSWGYNVDRDPIESTELLLESLCPPPKLKVLDITGYKGFKFPSWMRDSSIHNLVKISVRNCSCEKLPPLGQLPYLKDLCVKGMFNLESIGPEFYGDDAVNGFPSLEQFELSDIPILKQWLETPMKDYYSSSSSNSTKQVFPCLNMLTVEDCPQLQGIPCLPVLKDLVLQNSNQDLLRSLAHLTSLSTLVINKFTQGCPFSEESGNLNSVKKLMIYDSGIREHQLEGLRKFTSLEHLGIIECRDLKLIPEVMEFLPSLGELTINGCPKLYALPRGLRSLTRLQKLIIKRCPKLSCLPEGLEVTHALQFLLITGCPQLETRQQLDTGEDWPKIPHIPSIIIGHE